MNRNFHPLSMILAVLIHIILISFILYLITVKTEQDLIQNDPIRIQLSIVEHSETDNLNTHAALTHNEITPRHNLVNPIESKSKNSAPISPKEDHHSTSNASKTISESIKRHYGDDFYDLSDDEQQYILENLKTIRKINEVIGTRLLRSKSSDNVDPTDSNIVEFYLYPDGSISDLYLYDDRSNNFLDELTLDTIKLAHSKYPKPKNRTLIRIRVWILVKE